MQKLILSLLIIILASILCSCDYSFDSESEKQKIICRGAYILFSNFENQSIDNMITDEKLCSLHGNNIEINTKNSYYMKSYAIDGNKIYYYIRKEINGIYSTKIFEFDIDLIKKTFDKDLSLNTAYNIPIEIRNEIEKYNTYDSKESIATIINLNNYLCAKVIYIEALPQKNMYKVRCQEYRDGTGRVEYVIDSKSGSASRR